MPPKRSKKSTAARLPRSRLPVGAQLPDIASRPALDSTSTRPASHGTRPLSRATDHSITHESRTSRAGTSSSDGGIPIPPEPKHQKHSPPESLATAMSSTSAYSDHGGGGGGGTALSTAEAKLRRQNERIQQAEAALTAPVHTDRQRPISRDKDKGSKPAYKKMNIGWDIAGQHPDLEDVPPTTAAPERRINTFYPSMSRDSSLSRSISTMSNMTAAYDMERHDSMLIDQGFQYPRRGKPAADQLRPYEDKPEVKQKTVEATFDREEIQRVFGIDLPPLEFLHMNPGYNDAQLQFVMHPNGDVGAHMWSFNRYQWENIGDFSNIRKRIEGQLSSDRLKGETAWQTLQKNTLSYFRAISKQREQTTMGQPFGQQEIQQIMGAPPEQPAATMIEKVESPKSRFFTTAGNQIDTQMEAQRRQQENAIRQQATANTHGAVRINPQRNLPVAIPAGHRLSHPTQYAYNPRPQPELRNDDPFTAAMPPPPYGAPFKSSLSATVGNFQPTVHNQPSGSGTPEYVPHHLRTRAKPAHLLVGGAANVPSPAAASTTHTSMPPRYFAGVEIGSQRQLSLDSVDTPSRPKPATPLNSREAMRDQLRKPGETAKERSTSQNERTVLHDPFGSVYNTTEAEVEPFPTFSPQLTITDSQSGPTEPELKQAHNAKLGGWQDVHPMQPAAQRRLASLGDSVPDTDFPLSSSESRVTSGAYSVLRPSHVGEDAGPFKPLTQRLTRLKKLSPEDELREWWFSSSKFARQDDFFQSIKTLSLKSEPDSPLFTRTPSRLAPIGARSSQVSPNSRPTATTSTTGEAKVPWDEGLTRALLPVYESLDGYVEGPIETRRDYFSNWCKPPEWAIDRGPNGNNSFFDNTWGQPPARLSRDPRYRSVPGESSRSRYAGGGFTTGGVPISNPPAVSGGLPGLRFRGSAY